MFIFAWNVPLVSLIFLKRSLVFPILLFPSISLHWLLRRASLSLLAILWPLHSNGYKFPFLLWFWLLLFSQLFVRPPQTAILLCWSGGWQRGDTPIQGQEQQPWGDMPHPRSGAVPVLRWTSSVEIPHVQGQRNSNKTVGTGVAVRKYPTSKGKGKAPARQ